MREGAEEVLDDLVHRRLRGEVVDVDAFLAARPELLEEERVELRALVLAMEPGPGRESLPESFGPYRVLARLGSGGQGAVYLAEDVRDGRRAALKVVREPHSSDDSSGAQAVARLRREAELVARIDHAGVCKVYELGRQGDAHYLAMEYVEGETLAHWIAQQRERGGLPAAGEIARALEIVEQAAHVLHAAHQAGVVHRDVKPGNIMLLPTGKVVVLDFGLAKEAFGRDEVTQTGQILGSPAFMSPEQLVPRGASLDPRTDVYSLGVTLYECLTLRRPFEADERQELFRQIRQGGPPDPRRFQPRLDRRHKVLLDKALEPERRHRYPSALALAEDLARLRSGARLTARGPGPLHLLARAFRHHPRRGAVTMAAFLLAGLSPAFFFWRGERRARFEAGGERLLTQAREALDTNPYLALLLAIEGAERSPGPVASNTLLEVLGAQHEKRMLRAHDAPLRCCLRGPGGRTWITADQDGQLRVWDATSWRLERSLEGHTSAVCDAVLSLDEKYLATLASDGEVRLWTTDGWSCSRVLGNGPGRHACLPGFDARGRLLLCDGGVLELWDVERGARTHTLGAPGDECLGTELDAAGGQVLSLTRAGGLRVWALEPEPRLTFERAAPGPQGFAAAGFDGEGRRLLVVFAAGGACVLDLATARETRLAALEEASPTFAFAPAGGPLLVARPDGSAGLWDPVSGAPLRALQGSSAQIHRASFAPDGARVLTCSADAVARLWDVASGEMLEEYRGHEGNVLAAFLDPHARTLLTASFDGTLREWALESEAHRSTLNLGQRDLCSAHFAHRSARVVCAGHSGWVQVLEIEPLQGSLEFRASAQGLHGVVFSADDRALISASGDGSARLWDAFTGAPLAVFAHPAPVWDAQGSADGLRLLTAAEDGRARLWDIRTGELLRELVGHEGGVRCVRFVGDGRRILTSSETQWDASLRLWDAESGAELAVLRSQGARPISVATDPTGRLALAVGWWGSAQLWDLEQHTLLRSWQAHVSHGMSASFRPDGRFGLTSGSHPVARAWSLPEVRAGMTLEDGRRIPSYAEFSPDGRFALTASSVGRLRLWPAEPLERARALVTRELSDEDRRRLGL